MEKVRIAGVSKTARRKAGLSNDSTADLSSRDSREADPCGELLGVADEAGHRSRVSDFGDVSGNP